MEKIELKPIGFVSTKAVENRVRDRSNVSRIVIREYLAEALDGIEDFSHLFVIFWMNKIPIEQRRIMNVHPRGKDDAPLLGVFATRTSHRPNPIGLTLVELLDVDKNVIVVRGLDAFDNSPVLDIKPFDSWDRASNVKVPEWWIRMGGRENRKNSRSPKLAKQKRRNGQTR